MLLETNLKQFEIKEILKQNTVIGNPKFKGSPFAHLTGYDGNKPFYGKINNREFELTYNSLYLPIPYLIVGSLKFENEKTVINVDFKKISFGYYWLMLGIPIIFIATNIMLSIVPEIPNFIIILLNFVLLVTYIFILFFIKRRKTELITIFKQKLSAK